MFERPAGLRGTKKEAEAIQQEITHDLETFGLEMAEEKTLSTHAVKGNASFPNYESGVLQDDAGRAPMKIGSLRTSRRSLNGGIRLSILRDVTQKGKAKVVKGEQVLPRTELLNLSEYDITSRDETQRQGQQ